MNHDSKERNKWKVRITNSINQCSNLVKRPVRKLMAEVVSGILSSGSLQLSKISRSLKEPTRLHHTMKRISRMLGKHAQIACESEDLLLQQIKPKLTQDMVLGIDPGDLNRNGSSKSEGIGKVRDGDKDIIVNGYPLITIVARCLKTCATLPVLTRLISTKTKDYKSENHDIKQSMIRVRDCLADILNPLWVIDRGGDRSILWDFWIKENFRICVRATNLRHWSWRKKLASAQNIAKQMSTKHIGTLKPKGKKEIRFGITTVSLKEHPDVKLSMVIVRHGKQQPLVLVTTDRIRGRKQGEKLIHSYMSRWACEEGYRFSKQGFDLEKVQARKLSTLKNLIALATLAWGLLAIHQQQGKALIDKARRQKPKMQLVFPFYSMLSGWQFLFADAKSIFYHWWRVPKPLEPPIIIDMFANSKILAPN